MDGDAGGLDIPSIQINDHPAELDELNPLIAELKRCIVEFADYEDDKKDKDIRIQTKYQRNLARLCYMLEKILQYGLKDVSIFGSTTPWNYLEQLDKCLPGNDVRDFLNSVREHFKSNLGRGRVFIRLALNHGCLAEYVKALIWNIPLTEQYYRETSILRNDEQSTVFVTLMEALGGFKFNFVTKERGLDAIDYWERLLKAPEAQKSAYDSLRLKSPPMGMSADVHRSPALPSIETISGLVEQVEQQEKELEATRKNLLNYKVQFEKEKKAREHSELQYKVLNEQFQFLTARLRDMEVEVETYKTNFQLGKSGESSANLAQEEEIRKRTEKKLAEIPSEFLTVEQKMQLATLREHNELFDQLMMASKDQDAGSDLFPTIDEEEETSREDMKFYQEHMKIVHKLENGLHVIQAMKQSDQEWKEKLNGFST